MTLNNLGLPVKPLRDVTEEERQALATDGVVIVRGVLPDEWIEPLRGAVDDLLAHPDYLERGSTPESAAVMGGTMVNGFMGWMLNDVFEVLATPSHSAGASSGRSAGHLCLSGSEHCHLCPWAALIRLLS